MKPQTKIMGYVPFFRYTATFLLGILFSRSMSSISVWLIAGLILMVTAVLFLFLRSGQSQTTGKLISLLFLIVFIVSGFIYSSLYRSLQFEKELPKKGIFLGYVTEKSPASKNRFQYIVRIKSILQEDSFITHNEKMLVYNDDSVTNKTLQPGSLIAFRSAIYEITTGNNPGEFDYKSFMNRKGIRYQAYLYGNIKTIPSAHFTLRIKAWQVRESLLMMYRKHNIDGDAFSVLAALTLGEKNYLSTELKEDFAGSGAMHVLAVSGLHVGILYLVITLLLSPLNRMKKAKMLKVILALAFLWGYAFLTGLSPSVLRAGTMLSFIIIGENLKRRSTVYNTLAVSAFLLMLINPNIVYEVGFQLSYAAVFSIVFFQPRIEKIWKPQSTPLKYLWGIFTVSIAAQLGTSPVSMLYFHQFPSYFWLSNFVVIPVAAILLYLSVLFFSFSFIHPFSEWIAWLIKWIVTGLNRTVGLIESLPGSVLKDFWISLPSMIFLYLFMALFTLYLIKRNPKTLIWSLVILLVFQLTDCIKKIRQEKQKLIVVYNQYGGSLISLIDGKNHYYYTNYHDIIPFSKKILENSASFFSTKKAIPLLPGSNDASNIKVNGNKLLFENQLMTVKSKFQSDPAIILENKGIFLSKDSIYFGHEVNIDCKVCFFSSNGTMVKMNNRERTGTLKKIDCAIVFRFR